MRGFINLFGIGVVWFVATVAWMALGGFTGKRQSDQHATLREKVSELWGQEQTQTGPVLRYLPEVTAAGTAQPIPSAPPPPVMNPRAADVGVAVPVQTVPPDPWVKANLASTDAVVRLHSDPRRKGLVWYALYDVGFSASYGYVHEDAHPARLRIEFELPNKSAVYDDLVFTVDGVDRSAGLDSSPGVLSYELRVAPKQKVAFRVGYKSRGIDSWRYLPAESVTRLNAFRLEMLTDFASIDFPSQTLSPSAKARHGAGHRLTWDFRQMVTGQGIGMVMPAHIQPGELSSALSFSAPVSLLFFFVIVFVLSTLRRIDVHPINYFLIAAAFFAFHLLFAYSVDHLSVEVAFALCSLVSLFLVVTYLRLVISNTFAFREAALAQLVYLIGFSLAHFWEGFTGLTITVLAIVTLFVMMQLTGRVRWHEVLAWGPTRKPPPEAASAASP